MLNISDLSALAPEQHARLDSDESRRFTLWEMTKYILPISLSHLRKILRENEALPRGHGETDSATRQFSAEDIAVIRQHISPCALAKGQTIAVIGRDANVSAGLAALLSVRASLAGYSVLMTDLGPSGRASHLIADQNREGPAAGEICLAQSAARAHLKANQLRASLGEPPLALPIGLDRRHDKAPDPEATLWPGLTLLPGGQLSGVVLDWAAWLRAIPRWTGEDALDEINPPTEGLMVIDAGREPGPLMSAALKKADILLVADPGEGSAWLSSLQSRLQLQDEIKASASAALGETHEPLNWRAIRRVPINNAAPLGLPDLPRLTDAVLPDQRTFWDVIPRSMPRADYVERRAAPEALWQAVEALLTAP